MGFWFSVFLDNTDWHFIQLVFCEAHAENAEYLKSNIVPVQSNDIPQMYYVFASMLIDEQVS